LVFTIEEHVYPKKNPIFLKEKNDKLLEKKLSPTATNATISLIFNLTE
jgi:hypothetical protein